MIYTQGNLFSVKSGVIAHGCNCQGVMGSGVAKQVKELYPKAYEKYIEFCYASEEKLGKAQLVQVQPGLYIANLFTQDFYGTDKRYVDYDAVRSSFVELQ